MLMIGEPSSAPTSTACFQSATAASRFALSACDRSCGVCTNCDSEMPALFSSSFRSAIFGLVQ